MEFFLYLIKLINNNNMLYYNLASKHKKQNIISICNYSGSLK
jgi:hypothetical protein